MTKWFYEKNTQLIEHPINKTFEEILWMTEDEFSAWVAEMRKVIVTIWDEQGIPPRVGFDKQQIIDQFNKIKGFPISEFLTEDQLVGKKDVIRNTSVVGNAANQWFPTMMKTKINYKADLTQALSIYDHFKEDRLLPKMITYGRRHFKRDSFYHYSNPVKKSDPKNVSKISAKTAVEWIQKFEKNGEDRRQGYDYWIAPRDSEAEYTGYDEKLRNVKWLTLTRRELKDLDSIIPEKCKTNLSYKDTDEYQIRLYEYGQRIFPLGLKAFRVSVCQYAVNFPPLTAKFIYEKYCRKSLKEQYGKFVVWDPSSGWGGRILGAMGSDIPLHYIGTDPNTDHNTSEGRTKYHELADFYNANRDSSLDGVFFGGQGDNTYEIYQCGSEDMQYKEGFQKWKGKVDFVFTSPPYFAKEAYSQDAAQSCNKFTNYEAWRDGFLKPTLETAYNWLAPDRYLAWNIADIVLDSEMLPLEEDSKKILESLGMKYVETLKMALARMPGSGRVDPETGIPMAKNYCQINDGFYKYEPIFVYYKPS